MSSARPQLVATLPARSPAEARTQVEEARRAGADLAELRFDRWPMGELPRAAELFPTPLPLIATLRSRLEGGEGPDDPDARAGILSDLSCLPFSWIDLEAGRDTGSDLMAPREGTRQIIRSTHLLRSATGPDLVRLLEEPAPEGSIRKVVFPVSTGRAVQEILPALRSVRASSGWVVHTTGGSGPLLRALGKRLHLPFVYGSLPEDAGRDPRRSVEPTQIPVDRLRRYFSDPGEPPLFAVVGHPVAHSLSPAIHDRWLEASQRSGLYVGLDIGSEEEFRNALVPLGDLGFHGLNVTHPWKAAALAAARKSSPAAQECGAANCLTWSEGGWEADNTDVLAIGRRLRELRIQGIWDGAHVTVLGAGGAARATLAAARSLAVEATVVARRRSAAEGLARDYGAQVGDPDRPSPASLLVHATSAGRGSGGPLPWSVDRYIGPDSTVLDWVYPAEDSPLGHSVRATGASYESGERLLVYQAAASFENWWHVAPPPEAVRSVLTEVGCAA